MPPSPLLPFCEHLEPSARSPMSRRGFLRYNARLLLWTAAISAGLRLPRPAAAGEIPDIALAVGDRVPATRAAVELLGGMGRFVKPGQKVVIKPNMSFAGGPEDATDTNPEVVRELVAMCREAGAERVRVLDHTLRREERCIEGVQKACEVHGDDIVQAVSRSRFFKETPIPEGRQMTETDVMREVLEADVLIAAPVAKSHSGAGVSLSMKGMMGLVYNRGVMHSRYDLHAHSTASDGTLTPTQLMARAAGAGVQVMALTDHDTLAGLDEAAKAAAGHGMVFVPGVEVSVTWSGITVHVVGLGVDPGHQGLLEGLAGVAGRLSFRRDHRSATEPAGSGYPRRNPTLRL